MNQVRWFVVLHRQTTGSSMRAQTPPSVCQLMNDLMHEKSLMIAKGMNPDENEHIHAIERDLLEWGLIWSHENYQGWKPVEFVFNMGEEIEQN